MSALTLMITRGGQSRFTAAQLDADINLGIAAIGLTDSAFVSSPTLDKLPGEFKRITSISGDQVGDDIVHLMIRDDSDDGYTARGFGLFLADGTLFATYAQPDRLFEKSPRAAFLAAVDIVFPTGDIAELHFGSTDFLNPPATTTRKGVVELATQAEGTTGTDTSRVPPVSVVSNMIAASIAVITAVIAGISKTVGDLASALSIFATDVDVRFANLRGNTLTGAGLATGGGRNDENRTINVPAATADQIKAGIAQNAAITPAALRGAYTTAFAETGRRVAPDGFIDMWGLAPKPATEGGFTLNFPTPFPNACLGVIATVLNTNQTVNGQTTIQERELHPDGALLFVQNHQTESNELGGIRWRAWGY